MKAAVLRALGSAPDIADFAPPSSIDGEIIEVVAASIKQLDRAIAAGTHYASPKLLPVVPGTDGIGRLGGRMVYFAAERAPFGAMAQRSIASWAVPLPDGLDENVAAAIVNPALGAWLPLSWRGQVQPGESVLVIGATGATGRQAVAAAKLLGASRVVAAGRRADVLAMLGADATIDMTAGKDELARAFGEELSRGLDLVVDYIWGAPAETFIAGMVSGDLTASKREADLRYVSVGAMAGPTISLPSATLRGARLTILGSGTANFPPREKMLIQVRDILDHAAAGRIGIEVEEVMLDDVADAWLRPPQDARLVLRI